MSDREKLIELLKSDDCPIILVFGDNMNGLADYLIANGVTVQRWIQVSDQPKEKGCYFVTEKHWLDGKPEAREAYWNGADWLSCERRHEITPRVTHWMPLPEPTKEEEK